MILSHQEIVALTKREKPKAQCKVLDALDIVYRTRPDGSPVVLRAALDAMLGPPKTTGRPTVKLQKATA